MRKIILFLIITLTLSTNLRSQGCLQLDIVLLADYSASISGNEYFLYDALNAFIDKYTLNENGIRIGVIKFNNDSDLISEITGNKKLLKKKMDILKYSSCRGGTELTSGLEASFDLLNKDRFGINKIVIILTDGVPTNEESAINAAINMKNLGITICGIYIDANNGNIEFLNKIVSNFCSRTTSFENLVETISKLEICL